MKMLECVEYIYVYIPHNALGYPHYFLTLIPVNTMNECWELNEFFRYAITDS